MIVPFGLKGVCDINVENPIIRACINNHIDFDYQTKVKCERCLVHILEVCLILVEKEKKGTFVGK